MAVLGSLEILVISNAISKCEILFRNLTDIVGLFLVCSVDFNVPLNKGKRLQTTKGIKSCEKVQMCIELCTRV